MDILKATISHLSSRLGGVRVSSEAPEHVTTPLVTVMRTGGGGNMFLDRPRMLVHAWGKSEKQALALALEVEQAMFDLPAAEVNVADVTQDSLYSNVYPDGTRRWSGAYVITTNR